MTPEEFAKGMTFVASCIQKPVTRETLNAYFQMLGTITYDRFLLVCKAVVAMHVWNTFPSVAEFLKTNTELGSDRMTAAEAFAIASRAATQIDPRIVGPYRVRVNGEWQEYGSQADYVFAKLNVPQSVQRAIRVFGIEALCNTEEPIGVMRSHFAKTFDGLEERDNRTALLPPSVREFLENKRDDSLIQNALAGIGKELPQ